MDAAKTLLLSTYLLLQLGAVTSLIHDKCVIPFHHTFLKFEVRVCLPGTSHQSNILKSIYTTCRHVVLIQVDDFGGPHNF
jgi:hypothetical protein